MTNRRNHRSTVAEGFLKALSAHGIDYLFANGGTDFPPLIEALARLGDAGVDIPRAVAVPHENLAMAIAHGHTMVSGRPQAVMVHVNVGTANALNGLFNAARDQVPILLAAGRTPITERGLPGARTRFIQWAQEMFDQAALVRETVKWELELRAPGQIGAAIDRALSIALTQPMGPVYLSLPREVLAAELPDHGGDCDPTAHVAAGPPAPSPASIERAVEILSGAERPLIITADLGRNPDAVPKLAAFAERFSIPVVSHFPRRLCLPTDHPLHAGFDPAPYLADADAIVVLDCDVPWIPALARPPETCRIIHIGIDPHYCAYPQRGFPCHLAIAADSAGTLTALHDALALLLPAGHPAIENRRRNWRPSAIPAGADAASGGRAWISHCLDQLKDDETIVINELGLSLAHISFRRPGRYFSGSPAGALGWGLGAAIGAKLAAPERLVVAVVGDGSYLFGNPTPAHMVARALDAPVLFIVVNNKSWQAVANATRAMYPDGAAVARDPMPLTALAPAPDYEMIAAASGAHSERVERPAGLPDALARAADAVIRDRRQALLNVIVDR